MSFELINLNAFVFTVVALAGLALVLAVAAGAEFFTSNHRVRVARQQSIPTYYGQLLGAH